MDSVETEQTSKKTARVTDIVVRQTDQVRLIFRPTIVQNDSNPAACVNGKFVYQKKGKRDLWEDVETAPISTLKKGEGFQLFIHADELLELLKTLGGLYRLHRQEGVPQGRQHFIRLERSLARLLQLTKSDLDEFLANHSTDALLSLRRVAAWLADSPPAALRMLASGELPHLNALVGIANLKALLVEWEANRTNGDEGFWQEMLERHVFALSQVLAYPVVVIRNRPYLGGKTLDNRHGKHSDFLARVPSSGAAVLIEIKTPATALVGPIYRQDVFPPSADLAGAVIQVLTQRDTFMHDFYATTRGESAWLPVEPKCVVLAGSSLEALSPNQRQSFELFRDRLSGVTVITFDELFRRVSGLIDLLETVEQG